MPDDIEPRLREVETKQVQSAEQLRTTFRVLDEIKDDLKELRTHVDDRFDRIMDLLERAHADRSTERSDQAAVLTRLNVLEEHRKSVMRVLWGAVSTSLGAAALWVFKK